MKKTLIVCTALTALAAIIVVAAEPIQSQVAIPLEKTTATWSVPAGTAGELVHIETAGIADAATLSVEHHKPYAGGVFTNTLFSALAGNSATNCAAVRPVWLARGDKLVFVASATNTVPGTIVVRMAR